MLMETVILQLTDNDGDKHTFTLTQVNLLSTRVLSKQFTTENGFDWRGTGISSVFDDQTLLWDHVNPERLSRLILLGFQNVCLALVILNHNLLQHF